jgi:hypothetical protein
MGNDNDDNGDMLVYYFFAGGVGDTSSVSRPLGALGSGR